MYRYAIILLLIHSVICIDFDGWLNIEMFHRINCNTNDLYCKRGTISVKSIRSGTAVIDQIKFNKNHVEELKKLSADDGFYTMKLIVTSAEDIKGSEFLSSMKAQAFLDSALTDTVNLWVLPNGAVIAVNFQVTNTSQTLQSVENEHKVQTNFLIHHIEQAPVPDTASYIQKLEREREAREKGELKDNRSFLAKYWMYIVPIAIFVMISGATNPEGAGQPAARQ